MNLRFREDGTFRVLQLADIQDGPDLNANTARLITAAIDSVQPDLVVLTGDQIRGYDPAFIDTFRSRRHDDIGKHIRLVTKIESFLQGRGSLRDRRPTASGSAHTALLEKAKHQVRSAFAAFLEPITHAGIPFAATYGNHDFQCGILPDEQDELYREFPGCLNPAAPGGAYSTTRSDLTIADTSEDDTTGFAYSAVPSTSSRATFFDASKALSSDRSRADSRNHEYDETRSRTSSDELALEPGTFALPIRSADGKRIAMSVVLVNSGDYESLSTPSISQPDSSTTTHMDLEDAESYGNPTSQAVAWLESVQYALRRMNGGKSVPSIAFQHIPPQEFYDCLTEVPTWTPHAVDGSGPFSGHSFVLNQDALKSGGILGEGISCPDSNAGMVQALRRAGSYFALFCGHDHKNAFVSHIGGMDFGYAPTCGFASYGPSASTRGVRLFEFHESNPQNYTTRVLTWAELVGHRPSPALRMCLEDLPISATAWRNMLRRPRTAIAISLGALGMMCVLKRLVRRKR
ncbi:metallophosphoesterase [Bifidobacterium tsurumiense]|uniref:metallophosphoesterase n=1 Tax=Bifidobacterium tsurumiense TaxID=356829 RepID=UPI0012B1E286|nr:metallophosphoesterase [Bifidobacterium tsurumiense]MDY4678346.1 metallophosphoesterase [Bifidobacterium tsurumiense]MSS12571.1 serine/threonine protein phosphatase [Bifidobacterium tsurumiense]